MAAWPIANRRLNWWYLELDDDLWAPLSALAVNFGNLAIPPIWRKEGPGFRHFFWAFCHGQLWSAALHLAIDLTTNTEGWTTTSGTLES